MSRRPPANENPLQLLLRAAARGDAILPRGLGDEALRPSSSAATPTSDLSGFLWDEGADSNDLRSQRWGVVAPAGPLGDRLLAQVQPLIAARQAEQGAKVRIYRPPAQLDELAALQYRKDHFDTGRELVRSTPRYLLLLGDLDELPLSLQQVLQTDALVGRLAFRTPEGYQAYVDKVLRSEAGPRQATGRALFYAVPDGTAATQVGDAALIAPSFDLALDAHGRGEFPAEVRSLNHDSEDRLAADPLLSAAAQRQPTALLSVSHGEGPPPGGFRSASRQRERQGAMCFGEDEVLAGSEVSERRFLPQGLWLMVACYGAGTPLTSAYQPWLEQLGRGAQSAEVARLLAGLPRPEERPFVAALPQALLQSPQGPLAFIGHIDLAWTYSFADLDAGPQAIPRPARFVEALRGALRGDRVGLCCRELMRAVGQTQTEILALSPQLRSAALTGQRSAPSARRAESSDPGLRLAHLWMLRQDLLGYILLGDPAVRLPLVPPAEPVASAESADPYALAASLGLMGSPDPEERRASRTARRPPPTTAANPPQPPLDQLESAIGAILCGASEPAQLAAQLGLPLPQLLDYVERYRQAGRAALAERPFG